MSDGNGGVCQCRASNAPYAPECSGSVPLNLQDELTVLNGPEDLYIQWTYGREFVEAYQRDYGQDKATLATYEGPRWRRARRTTAASRVGPRAGLYRSSERLGRCYQLSASQKHCAGKGSVVGHTRVFHLLARASRVATAR
jgi:hypothetical protein